MRTARLPLLLGLLLSALWFAPGSVPAAHAATKTVTLTNQGPSPTSLTIEVGDVVAFDNQSNADHTIDSAKTWDFHRTIAAGAKLSTPAFTKAGTFAYSDAFTLVAIPQQVNGSIVAKATAASPTPTPTAQPSRTPSPTRSPTPAPTRTAAPTTSPSASPSPSGGAGIAVGPGLGPGSLVSGAPTPSTGPGPDVADPVTPSSSGAPLIAYGDKGAVVQGSPHRYGLPAALAVVLSVGVLSLIVRLLLSYPAAREIES